MLHYTRSHYEAAAATKDLRNVPENDLLALNYTTLGLYITNGRWIDMNVYTFTSFSSLGLSIEWAVESFKTFYISRIKQSPKEIRDYRLCNDDCKNLSSPAF